MDDASPKRRWWRKKRWAAALALWLALPILYPLSAGPAFYAVVRGWTDRTTFNAAYRPVHLLLPESVAPAYADYLIWWRSLAARHLTSD